MHPKRDYRELLSLFFSFESLAYIFGEIIVHWGRANNACIPMKNISYSIKRHILLMKILGIILKRCTFFFYYFEQGTSWFFFNQLWKNNIWYNTLSCTNVFPYNDLRSKPISHQLNIHRTCISAT